jgi:MFS family permease
LALGLNSFHTLLLWPLFAFYGLFLAATEGAEKALVADLAPKAMLGTAYGWFNLMAGAILLPASLLFGAIYQRIGAPSAFAFSAVCALAAAVLLPLWALAGGQPPFFIDGEINYEYPHPDDPRPRNPRFARQSHRGSRGHFGRWGLRSRGGALRRIHRYARGLGTARRRQVPLRW